MGAWDGYSASVVPNESIAHFVRHIRDANSQQLFRSRDVISDQRRGCSDPARLEISETQD